MQIKNIINGTKLIIPVFASSCYMAQAVEPVSVVASTTDGSNVASNTLDNIDDTRWSGNGDGAWIRYDLGDTYTVEEVDIAFYKGDERTATFDIETSSDANSWVTVFSGTQTTRTEDLQTFNVTDSDAQFVRIVGYGNTSNSWTSLIDVDITASDIDDGETGNTDDGVNIALNKAVTQSSTAFSGAASRAVDGDTNGAWANGSVTHTSNENEAWWQIDLGAVSDINYINLWSRTDNCCIARLSDYYVFVSDEPFESEDLSATLNQSGVSNYYYPDAAGSPTQIDVYGTGRYLRVQLAGTNPLSIAEFEVFSEGDGSAPTPTPTPTVTPTPTPTVTPTPTPITPTPSEGGTTHTTSPDDLEDLIDTVSAGDTIILTGSGSFSISGKNFSAPVTIRAATIGGTRLESATISNSNNVIVQGFVFGPSEESTLLKIENSTNIQVLRNVFDHENITENQTSIVTTQASDSISIGYNEFRDKNIDQVDGTKITGSFIKTQFDDPLMTTNLHIFRNHFNNIAPFLEDGVPAGDSDREAIAMGIADSQSVVTNNIVEYNLFENCDGENEIITVKTSGNAFRYNTFKNSMGSLSFRLGTDNEAYGNYFYGEGASGSVTDDNYQTGGIRTYGSGHSIYDNYMEGLSGISWRLPILIDSGDTSSTIGNDSHQNSTDVRVENNTIVDSVGGIHIGSSNYSNQPTDITITGNTVRASEGVLFNNVSGSTSNTWSGNDAYATSSATAVGGSSLSSSEVSILSSSPSISTPTALTANDVGPSAQ